MLPVQVSPNLASKIAAIRVPPITPNFIGEGTPGIGIGIAANKVPGIRAALCSDTFSAHATREHNDANILTLGERVVGEGPAIDIVKAFLGAEFEGDRHIRRINKITEIEKKYSK